jgi:hypothetical protein
VGSPQSPSPEPGRPGIDLYWIPLGAGGNGFVRANGRLYEACKARLEKRRPLDLLHTALEVRTDRGRFVVENAWPSPDADTGSRGVLVEGPVFNRRLARFRPFRYEVRCWRDGVIADAREAVGGPWRIGDDPLQAGRLLTLAASVPPLTWGRDEMRAGEMWNSNSVIAWLLTCGGFPMDELRPPVGCRAPGWRAGIAAARLAAP